MARDYARNTSKQQSLARRYGLLILCVGLIVLVAWQLIKRHITTTTQPQPTIVQTTTTTVPAPQVAKAPPPEVHKPRFEFYQILPSIEVQTPQFKKDQSPLYARKDKKDGKFVLQIASFRRLSDAKRLVNDLKRHGFKSHVIVTEKGDNRWYRVHTDIYTNRHLAEVDRGRLLQKNYKALLIQR